MSDTDEIPAATAAAPPRAVRWLYGFLCDVDPLTPVRRHAVRRASRTPTCRLLGVYRQRNGPLLRSLVDRATAAGWDVALWALDEPYDPLRDVTIGCGPGTRFRNLNRAAAALDPNRDYTIVVDDDIEFEHGSLADLVDLADVLGFHICQPAHAMGSHWAHWITRQRPFLLGRATTFVEIGPVVCFSERAWATLTPFSEDGMGWGAEIGWADAFAEGHQMGVVDAVAVRHLAPMAVEYDSSPEHRAVRALLKGAGATDWSELQRTTAKFPSWRPPRSGRRD